MIRIKSTVILCLLALALSATAANADTQSYSTTLGPFDTDWTRNAVLPQFDPALGTLNSITLSLTIDWTSTLKAENKNPNSSATLSEAFGDVTGRLVAPDSTLLIDQSQAKGILFVDESQRVFLDKNDGTLDYTGPDSWTGTVTASIKDTVDASSYLAQFTGTGTVALPVKALVWASVTISGNTQYIMSTTAVANVGVTYDYSPVPEPASLSVLAAGLLSTAGVIIRRRK